MELQEGRRSYNEFSLIGNLTKRATYSEMNLAFKLKTELKLTLVMFALNLVIAYDKLNN